MGLTAAAVADGGQRVAREVIARPPAQALAALLDRADAPADGDALPPLWHWLYFLPHARQSLLGIDGHPLQDLYPVPASHPRRMWAGGRVAWHAPVHMGEEVRRVSTLVQTVPKSGRSGSLLFTVVRHEYFGRGGLAIIEEQDIVYRTPWLDRGPAAVDPVRPDRPPDAGAHWCDTVLADERLLFRYSALTFNAHRIHYDRGYAREAEGYDGLVVQGPLIATLLMESCARHRPDFRPGQLTVRADRAVLVTHAPCAIRVDGRDADGGIVLRAVDASGAPAMTASVRAPAAAGGHAPAPAGAASEPRQ